MASAATNSETLITIKINFDGATRRLKLPLKDLGINVFEDKLRSILAVKEEEDVLFERYSDSASSYVALNRNNAAVYKQLGRAAKAKHKLKIRATIKEPVIEDEKGSKPASVEDEVEEVVTSQAPAVTETETEAETPLVTPSSPTASQEPEVQKVLASMESTLEAIQATMAAANSQSLSLPCAPKTQPTVAAPSLPPFPSTGKIHRSNFAVACNSCDRNIPEVHYHCSTCDDGDYDLCQECVDQGKSCHGDDHWLIKRFVKHGVITNSTTERLAPKPKKSAPTSEPSQAGLAPAALMSQERTIPLFNDYLYSSIRTCNCCVQELPEVEFVHCTTCEDFDLCRPCFAKNRHGHHPAHAFAPAVEGTRLENEVASRLEPGRDQAHNAICDGCDEGIKGIRHKCLDCPDWDYCSTCSVNSSFIHPGHRFVPIFEPLELASTARIRAFSRPTHVGICCDGPLCQSARGASTYIVGDRYKCAVCDDTDFCANCEASPANTHNKTHPLIKFKTPVRSVSVTTTGEHENGRQMPPMGDRIRSRASVTSSRATETAPQHVFFTDVQTVADVKPSEPPAPIKVEEVEVKQAEKPLEQAPIVPDDLVAVYVRDTVADGTVFEPDHVFEQTWILRNEGKTAWPAGCSVRYVGGDYMGHVDSSHPAATQDLESSSESTICYSSIAPGEEYPFTVLLRTPQRTGRIVSNWRLTTKDGVRFGHRLWCDVVVEAPKQTAPVGAAESVVKQEEGVELKPEEVQHSQMIFPKLDKESPVSSVHQDVKSETVQSREDEYEDCAEDDDWAEDESDGFMTDEEYDILDASDEEYQQGQELKK